MLVDSSNIMGTVMHLYSLSGKPGITLWKNHTQITS